MTDSWEEITQAENEQRHELHLNGEVISKKLEKSEGVLPPSLFKLKSLNYLEISNTSLAKIPYEITELENLVNLALHRNQLADLNEFFNALPKLKFFDLSFNKLEVIPEELILANVHTFNISNNQLFNLSDLSRANNLSILHIEHNKLPELPEGLEYCEHLLEVHAGNNVLEKLPENLDKYPALKLLDVSENDLEEVPSSLAKCQRMKTLKLEGNPLKDNRLRKMTSQCNTRAILEYIAKQSGGAGGKKGKKGKKGKGQKQADEDASDENVRKITIVPNTEEEKRVICDGSIKDVRPFICCAVIKNVDLTDDTVFKNFLSIQVATRLLL